MALRLTKRIRCCIDEAAALSGMHLLASAGWESVVVGILHDYGRVGGIQDDMPTAAMARSQQWA